MQNDLMHKVTLNRPNGIKILFASEKENSSLVETIGLC